MTTRLARRSSTTYVQPTPAPSLLLAGDGVLWQDSARTTAATADGNPVGSWDDASANASHANQATAGLRPILKTGANGLNGLPVVRFDGVDDFLLSTVAAAATQTVFIVTKKNSALAGASRTVLGYQTSTPGRSQLFTNSGSGTGYNYFGNEAVGTTVGTGTPTSWNIIAISFLSTASAVLRVGGGAGTAFNPNDLYATATLLGLGDNGNSGGNYADHDLAEVRRYDFAPSHRSLDKIGNALAAKWALTWTTI